MVPPCVFDSRPQSLNIKLSVDADILLLQYSAAPAILVRQGNSNGHHHAHFSVLLFANFQISHARKERYGDFFDFTMFDIAATTCCSSV